MQKTSSFWVLPDRLIIVALLLSTSFVELPASQKQWTLGTYWDTNPVESISNPEPTLGIKLQERIGFEGQVEKWSVFGHVVGQGFLEPGLLSDSKIVGNGVVDLQRRLNHAWLMNARLEMFQKLYFSEFHRNSRSTASVYLQQQTPTKNQLKLGFSGSRSQLKIASNYTYFEGQGFASLQKSLGSSWTSEMTLTMGQLSFVDQPARDLIDGILVADESEDQRDMYGRLTLHLKFQRQMILGLLMSHESISSNSVLGNASILLVKLYVSQRVGKNNYIHLVLQGMDKNYRETAANTSNPFRDPEEIIQNQVHCQYERVFFTGKSFYFQYSYLKNETIFNQWFYEKHLFEAGFKLDL
jgi:hypothetical protein